MGRFFWVVRVRARLVPTGRRVAQGDTPATGTPAHGRASHGANCTVHVFL